MNFQSGLAYTISNSSIYIIVIRVLSQDSEKAELEVAYVTNQGTPIGVEKINISKNNTQHWKLVPNLPFSF